MIFGTIANSTAMGGVLRGWLHISVVQFVGIRANKVKSCKQIFEEIPCVVQYDHLNCWNTCITYEVTFCNLSLVLHLNARYIL